MEFYVHYNIMQKNYVDARPALHFALPNNLDNSPKRNLINIFWLFSILIFI